MAQLCCSPLENTCGTETMMNVALEIDKLWGACPVQAVGRINDNAFSFRARYDAWSLGIADTVEDAVSTPEVEYAGAYGEVGGYEAGYLPEEEAQAIIRCCAQQYVAARFARERSVARWRALEQYAASGPDGIAPELQALIDEQVANLEAPEARPQRA